MILPKIDNELIDRTRLQIKFAIRYYQIKRVYVQTFFLITSDSSYFHSKKYVVNAVILNKEDVPCFNLIGFKRPHIKAISLKVGKYMITGH
jgi:hypothetical protein